MTIDIVFIGLSFLSNNFRDVIDINLWNNIHSPISFITESIVIEFIPSHGGGWKAFVAIIFFYTLNITYFAFLGYIVGLVTEKLRDMN